MKLQYADHVWFDFQSIKMGKNRRAILAGIAMVLFMGLVYQLVKPSCATKTTAFSCVPTTGCKSFTCSSNKKYWIDPNGVRQCCQC